MTIFLSVFHKGGSETFKSDSFGYWFNNCVCWPWKNNLSTSVTPKGHFLNRHHKGTDEEMSTYIPHPRGRRFEANLFDGYKFTIVLRQPVNNTSISSTTKIFGHFDDELEQHNDESRVVL